MKQTPPPRRRRIPARAPHNASIPLLLALDDLARAAAADRGWGSESVAALRRACAQLPAEARVLTAVSLVASPRPAEVPSSADDEDRERPRSPGALRALQLLFGGEPTAAEEVRGSVDGSRVAEAPTAYGESEAAERRFIARPDVVASQGASAVPGAKGQTTKARNVTRRIVLTTAAAERSAIERMAADAQVSRIAVAVRLRMGETRPDAKC